MTNNVVAYIGLSFRKDGAVLATKGDHKTIPSAKAELRKIKKDHKAKGGK